MMAGFEDFQTDRYEPNEKREGREPDLREFLWLMREWADAQPDDPDQKIELGADAFKLLVDIAEGKVKRPARRPKKDAFQKMLERECGPRAQAAWLAKRYMRVWESRYGFTRRDTKEAAIAREAERCKLHPESVRNELHKGPQRKSR